MKIFSGARILLVLTLVAAEIGTSFTSANPWYGYRLPLYPSTPGPRMTTTEDPRGPASKPWSYSTVSWPNYHPDYTDYYPTGGYETTLSPKPTEPRCNPVSSPCIKRSDCCSGTCRYSFEFDGSYSFSGRCSDKTTTTESLPAA